MDLNKRAFLRNACLYLGIFFSLILVVAFPKLYFHIDIEFFWKWGQYWNENWENIYISCPECNYPILGMFFSAGLMGLLEKLGFENSVVLFKLFSGIVDGINVYLIFWLLAQLNIEKAYL